MLGLFLAAVPAGFTAESHEAQCKEIRSNGSLPGSIVYSVLDAGCEKSGDCHATFAKERDRCIDERTLLKQFCQDGKPSSKRIACACKDGLCKSKGE
jgi:hypothetical protein